MRRYKDMSKVECDLDKAFVYKESKSYLRCKGFYGDALDFNQPMHATLMQSNNTTTRMKIP